MKPKFQSLSRDATWSDITITLSLAETYLFQSLSRDATWSDLVSIREAAEMFGVPIPQSGCYLV